MKRSCGCDLVDNDRHAVLEQGEIAPAPLIEATVLKALPEQRAEIDMNSVAEPDEFASRPDA